MGDKGENGNVGLEIGSPSVGSIPTVQLVF